MTAGGGSSRTDYIRGMTPSEQAVGIADLESVGAPHCVAEDLALSDEVGSQPKSQVLNQHLFERSMFAARQIDRGEIPKDQMSTAAASASGATSVADHVFPTASLPA